MTKRDTPKTHLDPRWKKLACGKGPLSKNQEVQVAHDHECRRVGSLMHTNIMGNTLKKMMNLDSISVGLM